METATLTEDQLEWVLAMPGKEATRLVDASSWPGFPAGIVTACGERPASAVADAKDTLTHVRSWMLSGGFNVPDGMLVAQDVFVLPKQKAKDVIAEAESVLRECTSYREAGVTHTKIELKRITLKSTVYQATAACYSSDADANVRCFMYIGRGSVVVILNTTGPDQVWSENLTNWARTAIELQLSKLPA
ncbi:hypothetical protein [Catellatospora sp. NPDC049133]|jgi:hypothetical protein|uniref:hypothetical protein n=1 Tax=Catellatospora sp. NPDC049133 TaxID=3155499 RepID=UPI0033E4D44A